jgi:hypothetical protein
VSDKPKINISSRLRAVVGSFFAFSKKDKEIRQRAKDVFMGAKKRIEEEKIKKIEEKIKKM